MTSAFSLDDVTVVCVTYNSRALIETMAGHVRAFPHLVVIDNGSSDGTADEVRRVLPRARVIARATNSGFGAANNEAVRDVQTRFALLLNPDCEIHADSVQRLLDCMQQHPTAGIVAPQTWRTATTPQMCYRQAFFEPSRSSPYQVPAQVVSAQWLHGCCYLVRLDAFRGVGGFDETFFLYYEDDDLCLRMSQAGHELLLEPAARALHLGGRSSAPSYRTDFIKTFHYARSRQIALRRYVGASAANLHLAKLLTAALPAMLVYTLMLRPRYTIRWVGWGYAALSAVLRLDAMPGRGRQPA